MTAPIKQVMVHWCPPHHSVLDLPAHSVSSRLCKSSQWRVESRPNKHVGYCIFWSRSGDGDTSPPKILIVGYALSVTKSCISEKQKWLIWNRIQTNLYRSERRLASVLLSDWLEIAYLPNWSDFFLVSRQRTRSQTWNLEWPSMPSLSTYNIIRIYSKVEDYETENKTRVDTQIRVRENGGASTSISSRY